MKTTFISALIVIFALTACAEANTTDNQSETPRVEAPTVETTAIETESKIKRVTKAEFKTFLLENENAQLIDVRTAGEFEAGAIEAANNIDYNDPNFETNINKLDKNIPVLIYCKSGGRSSKALKIFEANGFTHVLELEGGYSNW